MMHKAIEHELSGTYTLAWLREAEEARANPGEWFLLSERPDGNSAWLLVNRIRKGVRAAFRPVGEFEACARGVNVFVRYVGAGGVDK